MHTQVTAVIELSSGSDSDENIEIREKDNAFQMVCRLAAQLALPKASLTNKGLFPHKLFKDLLNEIIQKIIEMRNTQAKDRLFHMLLNLFQTMKLVFNEIRDDEQFNFLLVDVMTLYVNFKCEQGTVSDIDANFTNNLLTKLHIIFSGNNRFVVMTLLKVTCTRACTKALHPIFMKYLSKQKLYIANDIICYISLILLFRKWKQFLATSSENHVSNQVYLYNYCHISSIVQSILPPKVPLANEINQSFVRISDLIEFAMQNGNDGTNILLHNDSMDLNETIEKYIRQYEHYINRRHDLRLRKSVKAKSLRQRNYFHNGSSFTRASSDAREIGFQNQKLSHRFKYLRKVPEKCQGTLESDIRSRHGRMPRFLRREVTAPEKISFHKHQNINKKKSIERKIDDKVIIITSSSSSDEEVTDIPNRKRGNVPCYQIAKKNKSEVGVCNLNGNFAYNKVMLSTNFNNKNVINTCEFKIASDYQRLSIAICSRDINNLEEIQSESFSTISRASSSEICRASSSKICRASDIDYLELYPSASEISFSNVNSDALIGLNELSHSICSKQICAEPNYSMCKLMATHILGNINFNEFKNRGFLRKHFFDYFKTICQDFARYASMCAHEEKISDVRYINPTEKQFNIVISFTEKNLEKLLRFLNIKYSLQMNYHSLKFFAPVIFKSMREIMDVKIPTLFEMSPKNLVETKPLELLYKQSEQKSEERHTQFRTDPQKFEEIENVTLPISVPLEFDNMKCKYENEQKSWMKGLGLLPKNIEYKAKRSTRRKTNSINFRKTSKRKKSMKSSAQLHSYDAPDSPKNSSNVPEMTQRLCKEDVYTNDMITLKKVNIKQKTACASKAYEWAVQKNGNYSMTNAISGQQTKRKKRNVTLEYKPQRDYNFNSDSWKCEEKFIRHCLDNLRLEKLNVLIEKLLMALTSLPKQSSVEAYFIINKIIITLMFECLSSCSKQIPFAKRKYLAICQNAKMLQKKNINNAQIHEIEHRYVELKTFINKNSVVETLDIALNALNKLKKCLFCDDWLQLHEPVIQELIHTAPIEGDMFSASKALLNDDNQNKCSNFANDNDVPKVYQNPSGIIVTTFDARVDEDQSNKSWFGSDALSSTINENKFLQLDTSDNISNIPDISDAWCDVNGDGVWGSCDLDYLPDGSIIAHNTMIPIIPQENSEYLFDEPCMYEEVIEADNEVFSEILNTNEKQTVELQQSVGCSIFVGDAIISGILDGKGTTNANVGSKKRKSRPKISKSTLKSNQNLTTADVYLNNEQRKRTNCALPEIEKKKKYKSNSKIFTL